MKYWMKVILEDGYISCENCGRSLSPGDIAYITEVTDQPKDQQVSRRMRCPLCMRNAYPVVIDGPKL